MFDCLARLVDSKSHRDQAACEPRSRVHMFWLTSHNCTAFNVVRRSSQKFGAQTYLMSTQNMPAVQMRHHGGVLLHDFQQGMKITMHQPNLNSWSRDPVVLLITHSVAACAGQPSGRVAKYAKPNYRRLCGRTHTNLSCSSTTPPASIGCARFGGDTLTNISHRIFENIVLKSAALM